MITLNLSLHSNPRGNGFWKLNTSLLSEIGYVDEIKLTIQNTADEYKDDELVNPALLWEMIKLKVREKSISYSASKKRKTKEREYLLEREIILLEKQLDSMNNTDPSYHTVVEEISILKGEQEKILEYRTKGAIIRSKTQWYNEGAKNSSDFFFNLEKRHFKQGTIRQLKVTESDFVTSDQDILSECEPFLKTFIPLELRKVTILLFSRKQTLLLLPPRNKTPVKAL